MHHFDPQRGIAAGPNLRKPPNAVRDRWRRVPLQKQQAVHTDSSTPSNSSTYSWRTPIWSSWHHQDPWSPSPPLLVAENGGVSKGVCVLLPAVNTNLDPLLVSSQVSLYRKTMAGHFTWLYRWVTPLRRLQHNPSRSRLPYQNGSLHAPYETTKLQRDGRDTTYFQTPRNPFQNCVRSRITVHVQILESFLSKTPDWPLIINCLPSSILNGQTERVNHCLE